MEAWTCGDVAAAVESIFQFPSQGLRACAVYFDDVAAANVVRVHAMMDANGGCVDHVLFFVSRKHCTWIVDAYVGVRPKVCVTELSKRDAALWWKKLRQLDGTSRNAKNAWCGLFRVPETCMPEGAVNNVEVFVYYGQGFGARKGFSGLELASYAASVFCTK